MNIIRGFPKAVLAMAMLGLIAFSIAHRNNQLLLISGAAASLSWFVTEGPRGRTLPRWVSNVLLVVVIVSLLVDLAQHHQPHEIMGVVGRFAVWLILIKLYERKRARDYAQVMALSVVLALSGCLETVELPFAIVLVAYLLIGAYALIVFQLYAAYETAKDARQSLAPDNARVVPPLQPTVGTAMASHLRRLVGACSILTLLLSFVVFVMFPRGEWMGQTMGLPEGPGTAGLNPVVDLNDVNLTESRREVFSVRLLGSDGVAFQYKSPLLLRAAVSEEYDARQSRWRPKQANPSRARQFNLSPGEWEPLSPQRSAGQSDILTLEFTMRSMATKTLFSMYAPMAVQSPDERTIRLDPTTLLLHDVTTNATPRASSYRVMVATYPTEETIESLTRGAGIGRTLEGGSEAAHAEALRILQEARISPPVAGDSKSRDAYRRAVARAIEKELHSSKYSYTTDLSSFVREPSDEDAVDAFLRQKFGHCQFFASAMTLMCQSVGVPARLVTGFVATEFDDASEGYIVRESNAHAWVEVRTSEYGWTPYDPTPPSELEDNTGAGRSWTDRIRWLYDRIEFEWNSRIVAFDSSTQASFVESVGQRWFGWIGSALANLRNMAYRLNRTFSLGPAGYLYLGLLGFIVVLAILSAIKIVKRIRAISRVAHLERLRGRRYRRLLRDVAFYLDLLLILERAGTPKPAWLPPRDFAAQLQAAGHPVANDVMAIVDHYYNVRFGGRKLSSDELSEVRSRLDRLARAAGIRSGRRSVRIESV